MNFEPSTPRRSSSDMREVPMVLMRSTIQSKSCAYLSVGTKPVTQRGGRWKGSDICLWLESG